MAEETNVSRKLLHSLPPPDIALIFLVLWINCDLVLAFSFPLSKQIKKEEEEFSTGPLSVLMMSVKNNTQVGRFLLENTVSSLQSVYIDLLVNYEKYVCAGIFVV
jgi:hypothetical protein